MVAATIAGLFALLVIAKSFDEFRRRREPLSVFLFWLTTWLIVVLFAFVPSLTDWVRIRVFGPGAGLGTLFGISIVFLLFLYYRLYLKAERTERLLNQLISDLALRDVKKLSER